MVLCWQSSQSAAFSDAEWAGTLLIENHKEDILYSLDQISKSNKQLRGLLLKVDVRFGHILFLN